MADYSGGGFRGGKSTMKNSTVYKGSGYRAAPDIYETDPDTGNLRQSSGAPRAAGTTPGAAAAPAFSQVYADVPRPQGGNLAGSLATSAATKLGGKVLEKGFNSFTAEKPYGPGLGDGAEPSVYGPGIGDGAFTGGIGGGTPYGPGIGDGAGPYGPGIGDGAEPSVYGPGIADGAQAFVGATTDTAGNAIGWGLDGVAGDAVGEVAGAASGGIPFLGAGLQLAQGNVGGAAGSVIGGLIAGPVGAAIGGIVGGRVICTELHAQGLLDTDLYALDVAYTPGLHPAVVRGYHWWAIPYVRLMRRSALATRIARPLATWRARAIAYEVGKGPFCWRGAMVRAIGEPLCFAIGLFVPASDWTQLYVGGSK